MAAEQIKSVITNLKSSSTLSGRTLVDFDTQEVLRQQSYWSDQLEADSTIEIAYLPPGASIIEFHVRHEAFGAAVTAMIGDSGDADRYVLTGGVTTMNAAGYQRVPVRAGDYVVSAGGVLTLGTVGLGYILPAWTSILMTLEAANMGSEKRVDVITYFTFPQWAG